MPQSKWFIPAITIFALSCKNTTNTVVIHDTVTVAAPAGALTPTTEKPHTITGAWSGMFEPTGPQKQFYNAKEHDSIPFSANKITLFIDNIKDGRISGHSVCAGNDRPFTGTYTEDNDVITATLKEPGDDRYDGTFELKIIKDTLSLSGTWAPIDPAQPARSYELERKDFAYNPSTGKYPETSQRLLKADDVNNLYKDDLSLMRNEIYARHGYSFKRREIREWFDEKDWYMPISADVRKQLTAIELKNEALIKRFEKHASDEEDEYFGR